jgi:chromate transporter
MSHASTSVDHEPPAPAAVAFGAALRFWARLGCVSFGGPAAQIATMREELVVRRRWLSADRFDHALDFCMLLPGPEAQQLATYCGWLLHGTRGGLAAGILFVMPAAVLLFALSWAYVVWSGLRPVAGVLWGCKAVVVGLVLAAVLRLGWRALRRRVHWLLAASAFAAVRFFGVPFPWIVLGAALFGLCLPRGAVREETTAAAAASPPAVGLALWAAPLFALLAGGSAAALARDQFVFFSVAALVTFGGAYAVLAYVAQAAVTSLHWITATQAIDGLALAETTPGPGTLSPLTAATLGAMVTTWATFLPSMLFVFVCAPWVEALRRIRAVEQALAGVTAAVIGVIVDLGVVFGSAVVLPTAADGTRACDVQALGLALATFLALATGRAGVLTAVAVGAGIGLVRSHLR